MSDNEYKIESGIPIPPAKGGRATGDTMYPWPDMEAGDSMLEKNRPGDDLHKTQMRVSRSALRWLKQNRPHLKAVTRTMPEEGGVRVWFVKREETS